MADPKFVRLADRLARGMQADVNGSGWSIAGLDVKPMPDKEEEPQAYKYVRRLLNRGHLEEAGQAEFDEVNESDQELFEAMTEDQQKQALKVQEHHVQAHAAKRRKALQASRAAESDDDDGEERLTSAQKRRRAAIEAQNDEGLTTDDPEVQKERTAVGSGKKASKARKRANSARGEATAEPEDESDDDDES